MEFSVAGMDNCWRVEGFDVRSGQMMVAIFYGPMAGERAGIYASWLNEPTEVATQMREIRKDIATMATALNNLRSKVSA